MARASGTSSWLYVERCSSIIHILDATSEKAIENYLTIREELKQYNSDLYNKTEIIALNKVDDDTCDTSSLKQQLRKYNQNEIFDISAILNINCIELIRYASEFVLKNVDCE